MTQLTLFSCTPDLLEQKALLLTTLDAELISLEAERQSAAAALRDCAEARLVKDLRDQIRDAQTRRKIASADLFSLRRDP